MRLLGVSIKSSAIALLLGEILFWGLFFGYMAFFEFLNRSSGDDMGPLVVSLFLAFVVRPSLSGMAAILLFIFFFKRSTLAIHRSLAGIMKISLVIALVVAMAVSGSLFLAAIESYMPFGEVFSIWQLFMR